LPDCSAAFMAWLAGRSLEDVRPLVNFQRRLFYRSLRIVGWGHTWGNIVKRVCTSYIWWPEVLENIRHLVAFFRNGTWRDWIARALATKVPGIKALLRKAPVNTAKWRYETVVQACSDLLPLRHVCQELREEMFSGAQDKMQIVNVFKACKDDRTWKFVAFVGAGVLDKLEHGRRWGLCCSHARCNQLREAGAKHVSCDGNGRRLAEAWPFVLARMAELTAHGDSVTPAMCEGSQEWCSTVCSLCTRAVSETKTSMKYLGLVPWRLARASDVEEARVCITQIQKKAFGSP
jgi:hypothetical protein